MSPRDLARDDEHRTARDGPSPGRPRAGFWWPPRPATVIATMFVGASLVGIALVDEEFARLLSDRIGWPFAYRLAPTQGRGHSRLFHAAAMAADLVISLALLASTYATTQIAACLLSPSPQLNLRHLGFAVFVSALFLAGCRLRDASLTPSLYAGFCYGVACLVALFACVVLRLEWPGREDAEKT